MTIQKPSDNLMIAQDSDSKQKEETYYDILKVDPVATIPEIVTAYHAAKNTFSHESLATYSLFSQEELKEVLGKLDEAFRTLSNIEKRSEYDRMLLLKEQNGELSTMTELEIKQRSTLATPLEKSHKESEYTPLPPSYEGFVSGQVLKAIREYRGISLEDAAKTTKIPLRFVKALEANELSSLPARVYVQGFVKNLASLYKLDPNLVIKSYLDYIDKQKK